MTCFVFGIFVGGIILYLLDAFGKGCNDSGLLDQLHSSSILICQTIIICLDLEEMSELHCPSGGTLPMGVSQNLLWAPQIMKPAFLIIMAI